jgi:hypothetical protein
LGDGWVHSRLARFRVYAYDPGFVKQIRLMAVQVKGAFGLSVSESEGADRLTGTHECRIEFGGPLAIRDLNLGLANSPEGLYFIAGLWDADGGWYRADDSHPYGQARFFGGWHTVRKVKCVLRDSWAVSTGKMYVATRVGHTSKIGSYTIVTRTSVYGIGVIARSMMTWVDLVGSEVILKRRTLDPEPANPSLP